jgi:hypothetical protein
MLSAAKHLVAPSSQILRFAQDDSVRSLRLMPLGRPQVQRPQVQGKGDRKGRPHHTTGRPAKAVYSPCLWVLAPHQGHLHPRLYYIRVNLRQSFVRRDLRRAVC